MKPPLLLLVSLPLLAASPTSAQSTELHSFAGLHRSIPDGDWAGMSDTRSITSAVMSLTSLRVKVRIAGEFNGDLYAYLRQIQPGRTNLCVLLNRPGRTVANQVGYADSGLDITFEDAAPSDVHLYQNLITPAGGMPLTGAWQPDGRKVDPSVVTELSARTTTLSSFHGGTGSGEWTLYLADVESGATNQLVSWELELTGSTSPALTWAAPEDIVYGTPLGPTQLNASSSVAGTFAYSPPDGHFLNAGSGQVLSVTFTPRDTAQYVPVTTNVLVDVLKKDLAVSADNKTKVYGAAVPGLTATYSGFVNGDTPASLDTPPTLLSAATAASPAGSYDIIASGAADANYAITHANGTLTITPASLTIAADNKEKIYGAPMPPLTASYSGFVNGDTPASLSNPVAFTTSATLNSDAGVYDITLAAASSPNYAITFASGTLTILRASLSGLVSSSANPAVPGQNLSFSFHLAAISPGAGVPTGHVQFRVNGSLAGAGPLDDGLAIFTTSSLAAGTYSIQSEYPGDQNFHGLTNQLATDQVLNTPPVAATDAIERHPLAGAKVSIATLVGNDTDADGDALTFVAASATSANGGTIVQDNGWIFYTPPAGNTNGDMFTYSVADGRGSIVQGTVIVAIEEPVPSPNIAISDLGNGSFRLRFDGIPDKTYRVEFAEDVSPLRWQILRSVTADLNGVVEFIDTPPSSLDRFYRVVYP